MGPRGVKKGEQNDFLDQTSSQGLYLAIPNVKSLDTIWSQIALKNPRSPQIHSPKSQNWAAGRWLFLVIINPNNRSFQ